MPNRSAKGWAPGIAARQGYLGSLSWCILAQRTSCVASSWQATGDMQHQTQRNDFAGGWLSTVCMPLRVHSTCPDIEGVPFWTDQGLACSATKDYIQFWPKRARCGATAGQLVKITNPRYVAYVNACAHHAPHRAPPRCPTRYLPLGIQLRDSGGTYLRG